MDSTAELSANDNKPLFGFLNVYKPRGLTSHDVVARLRRVTKIKQIGHTGTLDPFAVGVLPVAIGKATKLIEYCDDDKEYIATVKFGKNTDTYDVDGAVTEEFDKKITKDELLSLLQNFRGEISQLPPIYSAIKVNGKKLYEYARSGEDVEIKPRNVTIYKLELIEFDYENQTAKLLTACSKGTYIRSLAFDIGKLAGCGAYLEALERVKAGKFTVPNSVKLDDLSDVSSVKASLTEPLKVIDKAFYELSDAEKENVSHGRAIRNKSFKDSDIVFLIYSGRMYAVGMVQQDKILVKKVFEV